MGLFDDLLDTDKKQSSSIFSFLEETDNDLDDYQKKLVKKGEYDSSNFEEEDLEEDDYYYEDDKE